MFIIFLSKMNLTFCFISRRTSFTIKVLSYHHLLLVTVSNVSFGIFITFNACNAFPAAELRLDQMLKDMTRI